MGCSLVSKALADPAQSLQEYPDLTSHIGADGDDVVGAMTSMFCTKYALSDEDCRLYRKGKHIKDWLYLKQVGRSTDQGPGLTPHVESR